MSGRNILRQLADALSKGERFDLDDGAVMTIQPNSDDVGSLQIGNGTRDMDFTVFLGGTSKYVKFDRGSSAFQLSGVSVVTNSNLVVNAAITSNSAITAATVNSTTASFTTLSVSNFTASDFRIDGTLSFGTSGYFKSKVVEVNSNTTLNTVHFGGVVIVNAGADTVITLPDPAAGNRGYWVDVTNYTDNKLTVKSATDDKIWGLGDISMDTVFANTASERIGASARFISTSTRWVFMPFNGTWESTT